MTSPQRWQNSFNDASGHQRAGSAGSIQMIGGGGGANSMMGGGIGFTGATPAPSGAYPGGAGSMMMMHGGGGGGGGHASFSAGPSPMAMGGGGGFAPQQQQMMMWTTGPNGQPMQVPMQQQQQGMFGGQYGQGCCGPDNPNQPGMMTSCCPTDPLVHICDTTFRMDNSPQTSALNCLWGYCDATTWAVVFFFFMSVIGFAVAVGTSDVDNLFRVYSAANSAELEIKIFNEGLVATDSATYVGVVESEDRCMQMCWLRNRTDAPQQVTMPGIYAVEGSTMQAALPNGITRPAATACPLHNGRGAKLTGIIGGDLCEHHSLTATAMLINLAHWNNFRGTLYFIAMMGTMLLLTLIIVVNRHQVAIKNGGMQPPMAPPYVFWRTNFYYMFRFAWGVVSVIIFLWICTEMYQFWWFRNTYIYETRAELRGFWVTYDKKFVSTVVCVAIFLCWPLVQLVASVGVFVGFVVFWMCFKNMCYPQLNNLAWMGKEKLPKYEDDESFCVSSEKFFSEYRQLGRLGFSQGIWELMTGTIEPYTTCGADQYGGGGMMNPQMMQMMQMQQLQQQMQQSQMQQMQQSHMQQSQRGGGGTGAAVTMMPMNGASAGAGSFLAPSPAPANMNAPGVGRTLSTSSSLGLVGAPQNDALARSGNNFNPQSSSRGVWSNDDAGSIVDSFGASVGLPGDKKSKRDKSDKPPKSDKDKSEKRAKRDKSREKRDKSGGGGGDSGMPPGF